MEGELKTFLVTAAILAGLASEALADQTKHGTAADAKAMLQKTIEAITTDKTKALELIAKGEDGFLNGDIYPFCFNATDGTILPFPNPNAKGIFGTDERALVDPSGKKYGQEIFDAVQKPEGQVTEVTYVFSEPMDDQLQTKVSFVTRIGDLGCGVGYYK